MRWITTWVVLIVVGGAAPVLANTKPVQPLQALISRQACNALIAHQPDPGVAYTPGVDVNGNPVTPADLPGQPAIVLPEEFVIDLDFDVRTILGGAIPPSVDPELPLGRIVVREGRAYFNDQPLQDEAQVNLAKKCRSLAPNAR